MFISFNIYFNVKFCFDIYFSLRFRFYPEWATPALASLLYQHFAYFYIKPFKPNNFKSIRIKQTERMCFFYEFWNHMHLLLKYCFNSNIRKSLFFLFTNKCTCAKKILKMMAFLIYSTFKFLSLNHSFIFNFNLIYSSQLDNIIWNRRQLFKESNSVTCEPVLIYIYVNLRYGWKLWLPYIGIGLAHYHYCVRLSNTQNHYRKKYIERRFICNHIKIKRKYEKKTVSVEYFDNAKRKYEIF